MNEKILTIEALGMKTWWHADKSLRDNLLAMFTKARTHGTAMGWAYDEEDVFKAVVGAVLLNVTDGPDHEWVKRQIRVMAALAHMINGASLGVTADLGSILDEVKEDEPRDYSLCSLWDEAKAAV